MSCCITYILQNDTRSIQYHIYENSSSWSWIVPCGRTDRHDEANGRFSQFCENASKLVQYVCDNLVYIYQLLWGRTVLNLSNFCFAENTIHLYYKHYSPIGHWELSCLFSDSYEIYNLRNIQSIFNVKECNRHSNRFTGMYGHSLLQK